MKEIIARIVNIKEAIKKTDHILSILDEDRKKKALSFLDEENRLQSMAAGYLIQKYTPEEPLFYNDYGKPMKNDCFFNVAHSFDYVSFVKADVPCGIDIEKLREQKETLKKYAFSKEEQKQIRSPEDFYRLWTRKEAIAKAQGFGLSGRALTEIPSNEGNSIYFGKNYYTKTILYHNYVLSVSLEKDTFDDIKIIEEAF